MSKYIIELEDDIKYLVINGKADNRCYTLVRPVDELEVLNSDYINEHYGQMQDEAYQAGLNDAWEAAKKIALMDTETSENVTGYFGLFRIMENLTPMQAIDKIKAYEDKHSDRIEVGDEVIWKTDNVTLIVTSMYEAGGLSWCDGLAQDGKVYHTLTENNKKTGKHYDIQSVFEAIQK